MKLEFVLRIPWLQEAKQVSSKACLITGLKFIDLLILMYQLLCNDKYYTLCWDLVVKNYHRNLKLYRHRLYYNLWYRCYCWSAPQGSTGGTQGRVFLFEDGTGYGCS